MDKNERHDRAHDAVQQFLMGMSVDDREGCAKALYVLANTCMHVAAALTSSEYAAVVASAMDKHFSNNPPLPAIEVLGESVRTMAGNDTVN